MLVPLGAVIFLCWVDIGRIRRIEYVSGLAPWSTLAPLPEAASPTGYSAGKRRLMVSEQDAGTYQWIAQTQRMIVGGEGRIRHVDSDNAPFGRETRAAAPFRWWVGLIAWIDRSVTGRAAGASVERAALFAGPALHLALLLATSLFVARRFGRTAAMLAAVGLAGMFPLAGEFLPGVLDDRILSLTCLLGHLLPLLSGLLALSSGDAGLKQTRRDFFIAGVAGGIGLWIDAPFQLPFLIGIALSALGIAWIARRSGAAGVDIPWRLWALAGSVTSLLGYLIEYFPGEMALRLDVNHPCVALAWLGGGELLDQIAKALSGRKMAWNASALVVRLFAIVAFLAFPIAKAASGAGDLFGENLLSTRLTLLNEGIAAPNFAAWISRDGWSWPAISTLLPLVLVAVGGRLLLLRPTRLEHRLAIALTLGPIAVTLALGAGQLRWWSALEAVLLVLAVAIGTAGAADHGTGRWWKWGWPIGVALLLGSGVSLVPLRRPPGPPETLAQVEVQGVVTRDVAYWLRDRAGPHGIVLTTPQLTETIGFHGGLRGIGTFDQENQAGFSAATRIASATTVDEAFELIRNRGITHLVIPSWDPFLDEYARIGLRASPGSSLYEKSFIATLHRWTLPRWLHPIPYALPAIGGFDNQAVVVLEVVDEQDEVVALSRLTDYFLEMEQVPAAVELRERLLRFRGNVGAMVALAQIAAAQGDTATQLDLLKRLIAALGSGADRVLPWDRRANLAILLAQAKQLDLAREQARRSFAELDETKMGWLTTNALFRFQALGKVFEFEIADPRLRSLALQRLPPSLRQRLEASPATRR